MCGEHRDEEKDEKELCFVVLLDRLEGYAAHEALQVDRLLQHAAQFLLNTWLHGIFDHLYGSLASIGHSLTAGAFEQKGSDRAC